MKTLLVTLAAVTTTVGFTIAIVKLYEFIYDISVISAFIGFIILEGSQYV